jgi:hypothetical protein
MRNLSKIATHEIITHLRCVARFRTILEWNGHAYIPTVQKIELSCPEEDDTQKEETHEHEL